jgi:hypothetical protein
MPYYSSLFSSTHPRSASISCTLIGIEFGGLLAWLEKNWMAAHEEKEIDSEDGSSGGESSALECGGDVPARGNHTL